MVDLAQLARYPDPYYTTVQFSSYDRRSIAPDKPGWFANGDNANTTDRKHYLRDERHGDRIEHVLADVEGPGAMVRFWSANPWVGEGGVLRVYLDDAPEPVIVADLMDFVNGLSGIPEPFASRAAGGAGNVYFPIPFAKRCKVTHDADWKGFYYQVNIRRYVAGTPVETFRLNDLDAYRSRIETVGARLADPMNLVIETLDVHPVDVTISPGFRGDLVSLEGPAAIGVLTLRVTAPDTLAALRQTVLQIYFDGSPTPQVESPLGDLFGAGPGVCPFESYPVVVEPDGTMHCRFVMPFARLARLHLANFGAQSVTVTGEVARVPFVWDDRSMHFRAKWRVTHGVEGRPDGYDMPYLLVHGAGAWVGTALMIMHPTSVPTPGGGWWGEGDEKIYVDGESFPSTFGTGSEDYFGYSWSSPDLFEGAYIGQPRCDGPGNRGYTANYRWHILDAIPFSRSIEFYMELQTHAPTTGISYGRIGYCYTRPGARDDHPQLNPTMTALVDPPAWNVVTAGAARDSTVTEAESLNVRAGNAVLEHGTLWSGGRQIAWNVVVGERVSFDVPVERAGKYRLVLCLTLRPGGGACRVAFGDVESDAVLHLAHSALTMLREFETGTIYELAAGMATLSFIGVRTGSVGVDYVRLAPVAS
jgi:hypothetical protein